MMPEYWRGKLYALAGSTPAFGTQSPVWGFFYLIVLQSGVPSGKMTSQ
jgi:hypothetical protein